ncbi:unnamed protein product, partial [Lymnaea stagnalis]
LSDETRGYFELINYVFLCSIVAIFGIVSNVVNIAVFYRQGLNNTVNISFTGLAISDLGSLVSLLWFDICVSPLFRTLNVPFLPLEVQHLTGGWPRGCFARVTNWITVFITAERCLCITAPLKVNKIITPKRVTAILILIYVFMIVPLIPEYTTAYLDWKVVEGTNVTLFGLKFTADRPNVEGLASLIYFIYIFMAYFGVVFLTCLLIYKLKKKTKWRTKLTSQSKQSESLSSRDKKTINMVIVIAIVFIVCCAPSIILHVIPYIVPGYGVVGAHSNFFFMCWSFGFLFEAVNASVDIILYYRMSSKYRRTFQDI